MKLVECVPNFSEGRDMAKISAITDEIKSVEGVTLLDVDPGATTNRTVVTFVGEPPVVVEAAFRAIKKAAEVIDMSKHHGDHPRHGATDVCPFVPVSGVTMKDCAELAHQLGKRIGEELKIPVYFYEEAATRPDRKNLADVRKGEYEALPQKMKDPNWKPDYGPQEFNAKTGVVTIGAREFLIAYNINFNTRNKDIVHDIALNIREAGRAKRDANGKIVKDEKGEKVMVLGLFKQIKAIGWYIEEYKCAQLSINFTNYKITPIQMVFDEVCKQAGERGIRVTGSELVGLIPKAALIEAGLHYLKKQKASLGAPEPEIIRTAVKSLGLSDLVRFDPEKKIIEYCVKEKRPLVNMKLNDFADELSSDSPAPGGGSIAAYCGALSAGLSAMVGNLTVGKKGYDKVWNELSETAYKAQGLKEFFVRAVDDDTMAFNKLMACFGIKADSEEEKSAKKKAIQDATKEATMVPFTVLEKTALVAELAKEMALKGNQNSLSDAGVAGLTARTSAEGAYYNVLINLKSIEDKEFVERLKSRAGGLVTKTRSIADEVASIVEKKLLE